MEDNEKMIQIQSVVETINRLAPYMPPVLQGTEFL
jgi:hypothetical protein